MTQNSAFGPKNACFLHTYTKNQENLTVRAYMQKTCDVGEKAILAKKKIAEKVRKSRQNVNRDKSA